MPRPPAPPYDIELYEDDRGHEPALAFMRSLTPAKRRAIGIAINEFLRYLGPDVVRTDFGKSLGGGASRIRARRSKKRAAICSAGRNEKS